MNIHSVCLLAVHLEGQLLPSVHDQPHLQGSEWTDTATLHLESPPLPPPTSVTAAFKWSNNKNNKAPSPQPPSPPNSRLCCGGKQVAATSPFKVLTLRGSSLCEPPPPPYLVPQKPGSLQSRRGCVAVCLGESGHAWFHINGAALLFEVLPTAGPPRATGFATVQATEPFCSSATDKLHFEWPSKTEGEERKEDAGRRRAEVCVLECGVESN